MLQPGKTKYRVSQKGRSRAKKAKRGKTLVYGRYGLQALSERWVKSNQIEAARKVLLRHFKGKGKIWIRIFPQKPITFKGTEVPMGGGKGDVVGYVFPVKPERIIFEVDGIDRETAYRALKEASSKLPLKTKIIEKNES